MPNMHVTSRGTAPRKKAINPEDKPIPAKNGCALCLYNIPSGSVMITMPGVILLITGIVIMVWIALDPSFSSDLNTTGMVFVILGSILTVGGATYWTIQFCKYKPKVTKVNKPTVTPRDKSVELVGVFKTEEGYANEAYLDSSQVDIATIS